MYEEAASKIDDLRNEIIEEYKRVSDPDYTVTLIYKTKILALKQAVEELGCKTTRD